MPRRRASPPGRNAGPRRTRPRRNPASHGRAVPRPGHLPPPGTCSGSSGSRSLEPARARRAAGPGPARTPVTSPGRSARGTGSPGCTCPPRSPRPRRIRWPGAGPGDGCCCAPATCARPATRGRESNLVLFAVDASGSMAARGQDGRGQGRGALAAARRLPAAGQGRPGHLPRQRRRGRAAADLLGRGGGRPAGRAADRRAHPARGGPAAGRGSCCARERLRDPRRRPLLVLVTDGRATGGPDPVAGAQRAAGLLAAAGVHSVVVDCESGPVRLGLAAALAADPRRRRAPPGATWPPGPWPMSVQQCSRRPPDAAGQAAVVPDDGLTTRQRRNRPLSSCTPAR